MEPGLQNNWITATKSNGLLPEFQTYASIQMKRKLLSISNGRQCTNETDARIRNLVIFAERDGFRGVQRKLLGTGNTVVMALYYFYHQKRYLPAMVRLPHLVKTNKFGDVLYGRSCHVLHLHRDPGFPQIAFHSGQVQNWQEAPCNYIIN